MHLIMIASHSFSHWKSLLILKL